MPLSFNSYYYSCGFRDGKLKLWGPPGLHSERLSSTNWNMSVSLGNFIVRLQNLLVRCVINTLLVSRDGSGWDGAGSGY